MSSADLVSVLIRGPLTAVISFLQPELCGLSLLALLKMAEVDFIYSEFSPYMALSTSLMNYL